MAIAKTYINGDFSIFELFLTASGLFDSVDRDGSSITCKDADENTLLTFSNASQTMTITAYASASASKYVQYNYGTSSTQVTVEYGYACTNGVMLKFGGMNYNACVMITKTNNGEIVTVMSNSEITNPYTVVWCVAWGDVAPFANFTFAAHERNQTVIAPFATCSDLNIVSFTDKAGYIPYGQYYNMGYGSFEMDGITYLTNGYWYIRDGGDEA